MTVISIISPKGGVGKTTTTASLGAGIARLGYAVRVVDLDPQNALRLHYGMPAMATEGIASQTLSRATWHSALFHSPFGVEILPYGTVGETERVSLERYLEERPDWLYDNLSALGDIQSTVTLIDTPPGPSLYQNQALRAADLVLVVLQPDAGSYVTIPAIEKLLLKKINRWGHPITYLYVLNQMDASKALSRDIYSMLQNGLQQKLIPTVIHRDEAVSEALAYQQPLMQYAEYSQAAQDIQAIVDSLRQYLPGKT